MLSVREAVRVQETPPPKINLHEGENERAREREIEGGGRRRETSRKSAGGNVRERKRGVPAFAAD